MQKPELPTEHLRRRIEAEEDAVVDAQFLLLDLLREKGVTQEQLAERLGVSKSRVSQLFGAGANPTLKSLARIFDALDCRLKMTCDWAEGVAVEDPLGIKGYLHLGHVGSDQPREYEFSTVSHSTEAANENFASFAALERAAA